MQTLTSIIYRLTCSSRVFLVLGIFSSCSAALPPALNVTRLESTEPECEAALSALRQGLDNGQLWADTMVDAGVRSPVGLLSQTFVQFGDFDGCLSLQSPFRTQFCLFDIIPRNDSSWSRFMWGLCVPAVCSAQGLQVSLQTYMDEESPGKGIKVDINPKACTTLATTTSGIDLYDILFCLLMTVQLLTVFVATVRDCIIYPEYDRISHPKSLCQCLSLRRNLPSLLNLQKPMSGIDLSALYGLRCCAFFIVAAGHRFGFHLMFMRVINYREVQTSLAKPWNSMWTTHAALSVDIYFFMSAFILGFFYTAELQTRFINPCVFYFNRLVRMLPAYAFVVFFAATLFRHLGDGPLWNMFVTSEINKCRTNWWTNLLFINNYVKADNKCLIHTWYLSCDWQLFVLGTLLVLLMYKSPRTGGAASVLVFLASVLVVFFDTYVYNFLPFSTYFLKKEFWNGPKYHEEFNTVYSQAHYRGASYIVGLLAGVYVFRNRQEPLSKSRAKVFQLLGLTLSLGVYWSGALFTDLSHPPSRLMSALYAATHHAVFGVGLAFILLSWTLGHKTFLSSLFSWRGFVPLSKLSYCAYLVHCFPQFIWVATSRTPIYMTFLEMISWTIADVAIAMLISLVVNLTVESPVRSLVKYCISGPVTIGKSI